MVDFFFSVFLFLVFFDCYFTFPLRMNMPFYKPSERALAYPVERVSYNLDLEPSRHIFGD